MLTKSAKAKGRKLQNQVAKALIEITGDEFIKPATMGEKGCDVRLGSESMALLRDLRIECKNQEDWRKLPEFWEQTLSNAKGGIPVLVIGKNRTKPLVVIEFDEWIRLLGGDLNG